MEKYNKIGFGIGLVVAMILLALLHPKRVYGQDVIMTSPIYGAKQGQVLILHPGDHVCSEAGRLRLLPAFGSTYRCDPDGRLIIGIDFQQPPGKYRIEGTDVFIDVMDANYDRPYRKRRRPRKISEKRRREVEAKRKQERIEIARGLSSGPVKYPNWPADRAFRQPMDTKIELTDEFGITRLVYYDKPENAFPSPHRGADLRARKATRAYSVGYCAVVLKGRYMSEGNMIGLYCGSGIYFLYMHLRDMKVQVGQIVEMGELIGHTGDTGVPGAPHLHFQAKIHGAAVDPLKFIEQFNRSLERS